ncbi:ThyX-like thymidylate synthase [Streptomyces phage Evy]|uniref:ThyX-like thymidylate synthase n=1 Tax=Streptomyces phage Evy TaxID=2588514 RepID=A0A514DJW2_9CAUD|nr:ThyX-like thymidylate synthase [Streptomyces phage Evy]QDH93894.1 ThyX-like thymidylate synthase [Streptomyces phage Evy]
MTKIDVLDQGYVRLVDHMGSDLSIVNAARVSYAKESAEFSDKDERLINFLVRNNEYSPFRHVALTFEVYAPLFVARQWWKYTVASTHLDDQIGWNESSRRYITEDPVYHIPTEWRMAPENKKQGSGENADPITSQQYTDMLKEFLAQGETLYNQALDSGLAPEQARLFLPAYGMYVRWRWTTSLASVMHFLRERLEHKAQLEIQMYAKAVRDLIVPEFPVALAPFKETE